MNYLHFRFRPLNAEQREILIAQLSETGFEGFEESLDGLSAFIPEAQFEEDLLPGLLPDPNVQVSREVVAPKNWNEEWEKNFEPVLVHDFCAVRASFHAPIPGVAHEVIITPKMSFGTGHHATTFLMIEWMQELDLPGKTVLDFGTGTGVLAILAGQCGAEGVLAIDNDDWSIDNATENILVNNSRAVSIRKADHLDLAQKFDIILANINKNVLLGSMAALQEHLADDGILVMSGLLAGDKQDITQAALQQGLQLTGAKDKNGWIALKLAHQ
ncbi:MAG: 50S ribosomal protein L11 methyltransferase [Candidatus Pseudobacter hemicellulosilyticus]|uniref:Ribosomal protein L11 methyltransferase n=1 Tax=Candidatus Pseudobacter hemicellulosilyticus TaxID=3121375 RepID=A0AAJ5WPU3_9BACT|nr:MAG: 50S ribosomal protein L11 methyltransferase [Pseudobacter sp.]